MLWRLARAIARGPQPQLRPHLAIQAAFRLAAPFALRNHASERMIADLADLDASLAVSPTGQSGQPFSSHWGDQTPLWADGRLRPMGFSRSRLTAVEGTLLFRPR